MEHSQYSFVPLLIIVGIAFMVPIVISRLRGNFIPIIVGEILAGIFVGKSGLNLVEENIVLDILSTLGFIFLMFLSGLEINISGLLRTRSDPSAVWWRRFLSSHLFLAVVSFLFAVVLSLFAATFLAGLGMVKSPLIMALILSTTSLGVVAPVLKQEGFTADHYGQLIMACSVVADFASIFLISVYVLFYNQGLSAEILLVLVLLAIFTIAYRSATLLQAHRPSSRFLEQISSATSQIKLRGALALAMFFIVLAQTVGSENILGAFLAGVIVSMLARDEGSALREKLDAIGYGFFIPIFFVMVGVCFDLPALLNSESALMLVPVLAVTAYGVKVLPAALFRVAYSWRESFAAGTLLSARLSLIIAASAIGLKLGVITEAVNSAVILIALVSCILSPLVFKVLAPEPRKKKRRILLVGCRHIAEVLSERLSHHGLSPLLVCAHDDVRRSHADSGVPSLENRDRVKAELKQAGIEEAKMVVVLEERDEDSLLVCRMARQLFGVDNIIAWVQDPQNKEDFRRLGARVVNPALSTTLFIESMILNPDTHALAGDIDEIEIRQIKLKSNRVIGSRVSDLELPNGVTVMSIERGGDILVPDNGTRLRENDTLNLAGSSEYLKESMHILSSIRSRIS
jgi:Kef-type K+ transport system membrane component KefB/Trk K+ transport system NAD-binding subunit